MSQCILIGEIIQECQGIILIGVDKLKKHQILISLRANTNQDTHQALQVYIKGIKQNQELLDLKDQQCLKIVIKV